MNKLVIKYETNAIGHGEVIVSLVQSLIDSKIDFQAFMAICTGIEYLGSFSDSSPHNKYGESKNRFERSLKTLFENEWYQKNAQWIFEQLRGPLLHQYRTGDSVLLTSRCCHPDSSPKHLDVIDGKTQFVLEDFFEDFKAAYAKLRTESLATEKYPPTKRSESYSVVYGYGNSVSSGTTTYAELSIVTGSTGTNYIASAPVTVKSRPYFKPLKKKKR